MSKPYDLGWNDYLDGKGSDDNPWIECSDPGHDWMRGYMDCEKAVDSLGSDNVERRP